MTRRIRNVMIASFVGMFGSAGAAGAQTLPLPYYLPLDPIIGSTPAVVVVVVPSVPVNPYFGLGYAWGLNTPLAGGYGLGFNMPTRGERTTGARLNDSRRRHQAFMARHEARMARHQARMECWDRQRAAKQRWRAFWIEQRAIRADRIKAMEREIEAEWPRFRDRPVGEYMRRLAVIYEEDNVRTKREREAQGVVNPWATPCS